MPWRQNAVNSWSASRVSSEVERQLDQTEWRQRGSDMVNNRQTSQCKFFSQPLTTCKLGRKKSKWRDFEKDDRTFPKEESVAPPQCELRLSNLERRGKVVSILKPPFPIGRRAARWTFAKPFAVGSEHGFMIGCLRLLHRAGRSRSISVSTTNFGCQVNQSFA